MQRNVNMGRLTPSYLFPEIQKRKKEFLARNPKASLISLGIGDTTEPISQSVVKAFIKASEDLGTIEKYSGYGPEQGHRVLREKIAEKIYANRIDSEDIFISDGAKCDLGRLQILFGPTASIAVQDPAYPVYVDGSLIQGVHNILFMPCSPENGFFPDLQNMEKTHLIYFCSPNNPTGTAATRPQLEALVQFARVNHSILIFDAAYANYIQDTSIPKSIFEIEGARQVAIEIGSFSKLAGFTGVRLGWTVISEELRYDDGVSVKADWGRIVSTLFNGASNIAQAGGLAALEEEGLQSITSLTQFYLRNGEILRKALEELGCEVFGGIHAPYLWVRFKGKSSWEMFQYFLEQFHIITTPGSGFGPAGEEFLRFTAFGHREKIWEAIGRLKSCTTTC